MTALVDTGFMVALLNRRDTHHTWAATEADKHPRPWHTCEPVLAETFFQLGEPGTKLLGAFLRRESILVSFSFANDVGSILDLMQKYADMPMSLADACLVRMSEVLPHPVLLTTDRQFKFYRRHSRQTIPSAMPY